MPPLARPRLEHGVVPVEGDAGVVEEAVRPCADHRVGPGIIAMERRRRDLLLRVAGKERALPRRSAVGGGEHTEPRISGHLVVGPAGEVHRAVVVRPCDEVQRVSGRDCDGRLVLPLQERVAAGPAGARDHVDVAAGHLSAGHADGQHGHGQERKPGAHAGATHDRLPVPEPIWRPIPRANVGAGRHAAAKRPSG